MNTPTNHARTSSALSRREALGLMTATAAAAGLAASSPLVALAQQPNAPALRVGPLRSWLR